MPRHVSSWTPSACDVSIFELISASSQATRRKRKKRRKEASSSHLLSAFAVQKTVESPQLPFFNVVVAFSFRAANADLMVQSIQQTTEFPQLLYVSGGRCPCFVGCAASDAPRLCSSWLLQAKFGRYGPEGQLQWRECWFAGYNTPRAVFSFLVRRPMMLDIMAGMDPFAQRPLYAARVLASRCRVVVVFLLMVLTILFGTV